MPQCLTAGNTNENNVRYCRTKNTGRSMATVREKYNRRKLQLKEMGANYPFMRQFSLYSHVPVCCLTTVNNVLTASSLHRNQSFGQQAISAVAVLGKNIGG